MIIEKISIKNFRSIVNVQLDIKKIGGKLCYIFLGKNETGKSSILKAISLLNTDRDVDYFEDCNKGARKIKEPIAITYQLNVPLILKTLGKEIQKIKIPKDILNEINIYKIEWIMTIDPDNERYETLNIYMNDNKSFANYVIDRSSDTIDILINGTQNRKLSNEDVKLLYSAKHEVLSKGALESIFESSLFENIKENLPSCLFWEPSENYLINEPIDLNQFALDPEVSIPLKNIFDIAGIKNIKDTIELVRTDLEERSQLKQELSLNITEYINKVWPEHLINIYVEIESMKCSVMVEDKDDSRPKYRMTQRSDGFKQFVSILLNLSLAEMYAPKNRIILMDEPEVHLHPSGIKYLRDELLKLSENNLVLISSHSTYMVDKLNLERHYKVEKEKSLTSLKQIKPDNPYEEEVIYEALGTSIYEYIQPNMIVFEGTIDRDLFNSFFLKFKVDFKPLAIGAISADGVEKIPQYAKFISGTFVKGFVLVDSDADGKRIKAEIINQNKYFTNNNTFEINDINNTAVAATIEDLYPKKLIVKTVLEQYGIELNLDTTPVIKQIESKNKLLEKKINLKELKASLAQTILSHVSKGTKDEIKESYNDLYLFMLN